MRQRIVIFCLGIMVVSSYVVLAGGPGEKRKCIELWDGKCAQDWVSPSGTDGCYGKKGPGDTGDAPACAGDCGRCDGAWTEHLFVCIYAADGGGCGQPPNDNYLSGSCGTKRKSACQWWIPEEGQTGDPHCSCPDGGTNDGPCVFNSCVPF
jgi:hypothetical protein